MAELDEAYGLQRQLCAQTFGTPLAPLIPERLQPMENVRERIAQLKQEKAEHIRNIGEQDTYFKSIDTQFQSIHSHLDETETTSSLHSVFDELRAILQVALDEKRTKMEAEQKAVSAIDEELVLVHRFVKTCLLATADDTATAAATAVAAQHNRCPICMEAEINRCIVPCGHTFCTTCSRRLFTCPVCRGMMESCIPLFINI